jgi:chemotaxis protein CheD
MRRVPIVQGEHAVISEPQVMITTLLGSCVAVCLYDAKAKVGGMNHFLLGEPGADQAPRSRDMTRYGVHAMELLINEMMAKGASRGQLRAHLYGGATMISGLGSIGANNAAFARRFMETEGIAVGHCDLGGKHARKVEFLPHDGRSRCTQVQDPDPMPALPTRPARKVSSGELELF